MAHYTPPAFLTELLHARSPSGYEAEAQAVFERHVRPAADSFAGDALGNRIATLNPSGDPTLMLAGHMDELGLIITYVNKDGFIYFDTIGGHDRTVISGRRVVIQTAKGTVKGVTGKRAIHLMDEADRKKVPEIHEIWIDIGAKSKKEALQRISIGDAATYDHEFELIHGTVGTARAFDNKVGAYIVGETLIRLSKDKTKPCRKGRGRRHHPGGDRRPGRHRFRLLGRPAGGARGRCRPRDRPPGLRQPKVRRDEAGRRPHHLPRGEHQPKGVRGPREGSQEAAGSPTRWRATPGPRARTRARSRWRAAASPPASSASPCATCTRRARSWTLRTWSAASGSLWNLRAESPRATTGSGDPRGGTGPRRLSGVLRGRRLGGASDGGPAPSGHGRRVHDHLGHVLLLRQVVHDLEHDALEDRPERAGAGLQLDGLQRRPPSRRRR